MFVPVSCAQLTCGGSSAEPENVIVIVVAAEGFAPNAHTAFPGARGELKKFRAVDVRESVACALFSDAIEQSEVTETPS